MNNSARLIIVLVVFSTVSLSAQSPTPVATQDNAFQVRYYSGPPLSGEGVVNIPNAGASPSPANPKAASPAPTATVAPVASSATKQSSPVPTATVAPVASSATEPVIKTTPEPRAGSRKVVRDGKTRGQHGQRVYHKDGSKWHERTKKGKYRREQRATKEGDHASKEEGKTGNQ
jgi:hypothetical protein